MTAKILRPLLLALFFVAVLLGASRSALATATIVILNNDAAGVGFNDTTAAAPVGGNTGTTLGQQRLNAFQAAADKWGATIDSPITITIRAQWAAQSCTATGAVLGSAGAIGIFRDFPGFPFGSTWYNESLGSKLFGSDLNATQPEINATFNINLGQPGCLTGTFFYLGLDNNHGTNIDLVTVLEHEFAHGLGFQTFTNAQTGALNSGFPAIYDRFLMDNSNGKSWLQMTNAERAASSINTHKLVWNGPQVQTDVPTVLSLGEPGLTINSPAGIAGSYDPGSVAYDPDPPVGGVTGNLKLANDGTAPVEDGCEAFPAGFFTGQIALIDRGTCSIKAKTLNAQNAGAIAVIIVNNAAGTPAPDLGDDPSIVTPITISTISVTQADGNTIKAQLGTGVNATIFTNPNVRAGADQFGKMQLYTPTPFNGGSSVSHWATTATPNLLMEPNISSDLTHEVATPQDLTFSQLRDIGWVPSAIPTAIAKTGGDNQNTALNATYATPPQVTVSPAIAGITVTWTTNNGGSGAGATFPSTSGRQAVSVTNASGVATAPTLTANGTSGQLSLVATAPGAGSTTFTLLVDPAPVAGPACVNDTTQTEFAAGTTNNTDVNASPGNVVLLNPATADQTQTVASTSGTGFNTTQWLGQTFVPGVTGQLARIDMALFCASCSGTDQPITVEIRTTTGSPALPTSTVLATTTLAGFNSGVSSTFSAIFASPPTLTAGTTYAYTLRLVTNRTGTYAAVFGNAPTDYANGNRVVTTNSGGTWTVPTSTGTARDLVFTTFMQTGNAPSGDYVSSVKDSNPPVAGTTQWGTLSWNATVPANTTLQFQAAASNSFGGPFNFVGPDGTSGTFFTNGASLAQFNGLRYLKYKAFFTTTNSAATASLSDVTVCFNNPAPTTTALTSDINPSTVGQSVTFTATVSAASGTPTGTVNFKEGVTTLGSGTLNGSGVATFSTSALAAGSHVITAEYVGDTNFSGSTSPPLTQEVVAGALAIDNVTMAEGNSGTTTFAFTVTRSGSTTGSASVAYATADGTATLADNDYQSASGTLNFGPGETTKPVNVTVNGDTTPEVDETFTVVLSSPSNASISDDTGTGTISNDDESVAAGQLIISEFRLRGPGPEAPEASPSQPGLSAPCGNSNAKVTVGTRKGPRASILKKAALVPDTSPEANDEFIELYNNTDAPLFVATTDGSKGWAVAASDGLVRFIIPTGTIIPARAHFLSPNLLGYSLGSIAAGDFVIRGDDSTCFGYELDIPDNAGIAVFRTSSVANFTLDTRLDAVGSTSESNTLYREGAGYTALSPATTAQNLESSFHRSMCAFVSGVGCTAGGNPKDSGDNAVDFLFADTFGTITEAGQRLGAPGPESLTSPIRRDASGVGATLLDGTQSSSAAPNRARSFTPVSNGTFGTMTIRRRVVNNTGGGVTQLRFRIIELTTFPSPGGGQADLRAINSLDEVSVGPVNDATTCTAAGAGSAPCNIAVKGTTLEQPPSQPNGGGFNSTLTVTLGSPLANGASLPVNFQLGIMQTGTFRFYVIVEALP